MSLDTKEGEVGKNASRMKERKKKEKQRRCKHTFLVYYSPVASWMSAVLKMSRDGDE